VQLTENIEMAFFVLNCLLILRKKWRNVDCSAGRCRYYYAVIVIQIQIKSNWTIL